MNILILSDFVGCGNVAMGVARAVLTHMGHNALCLPTALISNTWNLGAPAVLDTTAYLQEALAAWERLGIQPEGVLLGYLADEAQTVFIEEQCRRWREKGIKIFLDPIFADNGKLYRGITAARIAFLKRLLPHIDYVLPNVTEAQFLTGEADSMAAARALVQLGADCAVLTGVEDSAVVLAQGDGICRLDYTPVPGHYSGAGDSFTALFTGNILNGNSPAKSARLAADTLCQWIDRYRQSPSPITGLPVERLWE